MNTQYEQDIYLPVFEFIVWLSLIVLSIMFSPILLIIIAAGIFLSFKISLQNKLLRKQATLLEQLNVEQTHTKLSKGIYIDKEG